MRENVHALICCDSSCADSCLQIITMLSEADCMPSEQDGNGDLPIHIAIRNGHMDAMKALLAIGSPLNVRNSRGDSPVTRMLLSGLVCALVPFFLLCVRLLCVLVPSCA